MSISATASVVTAPVAYEPTTTGAPVKSYAQENVAPTTVASLKTPVAYEPAPSKYEAAPVPVPTSRAAEIVFPVYEAVPVPACTDWYSSTRQFNVG